MEHEPYNTKIAISDTTRKNTGIYTIKAENANGKDEAEVEVIILGKVVVISVERITKNRK